MEEQSDSEERGAGFIQNANTGPLITRYYTSKSLVLILPASRVSVYLMYPV